MPAFFSHSVHILSSCVFLLYVVVIFHISLYCSSLYACIVFQFQLKLDFRQVQPSFLGW